MLQGARIATEGEAVTHDSTADHESTLQLIAERLRDEFHGVFDAPTIDGCLADAAEDLRHRLGNPPDLAKRIERFAHDRLQAMAQIQSTAERTKPSVLFLCVHNAGRSQMAAGWLRHLAGGTVDVYSGGSEPAHSINPSAVAAMAEVGIDISQQVPQPWADEIVQSVDVVVTMGCGDTCPYFPGTRYVDWELDDPAGKPIEAVRPVRDEIESRVRTLIAELDV